MFFYSQACEVCPLPLHQLLQEQVYGLQCGRGCISEARQLHGGHEDLGRAMGEEAKAVARPKLLRHQPLD